MKHNLKLKPKIKNKSNESVISNDEFWGDDSKISELVKSKKVENKESKFKFRIQDLTRFIVDYSKVDKEVKDRHRNFKKTPVRDLLTSQKWLNFFTKCLYLFKQTQSVIRNCLTSQSVNFLVIEFQTKLVSDSLTSQSFSD